MPSKHKRLEQKLPSLLIDGPTTKKENFNEYRKVERILHKMKRTRTTEYNSWLARIDAALYSDIVGTPFYNSLKGKNGKKKR